jgi:acetyl esterase/lipase
VAFLFLEYTLVPHATYPTQICEGVEAVEYVMTELGRPASDIMLGGDSAGGNLCLAVLSHVMHPAEDVPALTLPAGQKLKALVLVSPWVSFRTDWLSARKSRDRDIVSTAVGDKWSRDYLAGKPTSPYAEALLAPADWWKDPQVELVLCLAGNHELLFDPISAWAHTYKVSESSCPLFCVRIGKNLATDNIPISLPVPQP